MATGQPHIKTESTSEVVKMMIANGVPQEAVAKALGISVDTLDRHYRAEMDIGYTEVYSKLAENVVKQGLKDSDKAAQIALRWLSMRGNWAETKTIDVNVNNTGRDSESLRKALSVVLGVSVETVRRLTDQREEGDVSGEPDDIPQGGLAGS